LQERLSSWSRLKMPGEMEDIFDKLCPPDQVWKIQSLEIDLGPISFNELEPQLSLRLRKQLTKKMTDLVLYRNEDGNAIEIIDEDKLHIDLISHFLLQGLIPWNYKSIDKSINDLLVSQLQKNRQKVVTMLREIGATHQDVRKRLAWQITEANIIKIIEGLEPNNAQQVIDFSSELTAIQKKESIVQTGMADFKKHLWFWILNYLLAERGSVFNKVTFIRSNLNQMAAHYHISYDELIGMIGRAVEKVEERNIIKDNVMLTLRILTDENRLQEAGNKNAQQGVDIHLVLENYFSGQVTPSHQYSIAELNDMVLTVAGRNDLNFRQLLLSFSDREDLLAAKLSLLNENSLEAIFLSLSGDGFVISKRDIHYLSDICRQLKVEERFLWEAAIKFVIANKGLSFTQKSFLNHLVTELGRKNQISKASALEQMLCADVPPGTKPLSSLAVYSDLSAAFAAEISGKNRTVTVSRFKELLDMLGHQIRNDAIEKPVFLALLKPLARYIRLNPAAAFEALTGYPDKRNLQKLLPYLLDESLANLLMCNAKSETVEILLSLSDVLQGAGTSFSASMARTVTESGLDVILCGPGSNATKEMERLLEQITQSIPFEQLGQFFELLDDWRGTHKIAGKIISAEFITGIKQRLITGQNQLLFQQVAALMQNTGNEVALTRLLSANFEEQHFVKLRKYEDKESAALLNYLLRGGANLMEALIKKYVSLLKGKAVRFSENITVMFLKNIYWKCILDHSYHCGDAGALHRLFETAVYSAFHITGEDAGETVGAIRLLNGQKITIGELLSFIEKSIRSAQDTVIVNGQVIRLGELMLMGLEAKPAELCSIIKNIAISEKRIRALSRAISFDQFCLLITNGSGSNMSDAITSVRVLYTLADRVTSGRVSEKLLYAYWRAVWIIIRTNNLKPADLKSLVAESMYWLAVEKQVNSTFIISEIRKLPLQFTSALKTAFAGYDPVFADLPVKETAKLSRELREIKQKGLLYSLSYHIITRKQAPLWLYTDTQKTSDILNEIVAHDAINLLLVLKHEMVSERQMAWLHDTISFSTLINSVIALNPDRQVLLNDLEQLYKLAENVSIAGVSAMEMRHLLFSKLMLAWTGNNWVNISGERLWSELIWDISVKKGSSKKQLIRDIGKTVSVLPLSLQIGFRHLKEQEKSVTATKPAIAGPVKHALPTGQAVSSAKEGIVVKNAGLVLVNNYIPVLFERLGLVENKTFIHTDAREKAVHYLQYVVTGLNGTEEYLLPLNKVMCGLPLVHPIDYGIEIIEEHHDIIEGLVKAMIAHWPSIGNNSVYGFRGNWLVRDGLLTELDDKWELTVEKRAYDVLLNKSPFSFSIIKHPWMDKPIHVTWSY